jgi:PIN domain nuclease of toxin-antitoxin system
VRLLLDTQVLVWAVGDNPRLPPAFREAIADPGNECWISVGAWWEIGIKSARGRLELKRPLPDYATEAVTDLALLELPVVRSHVVRAASLPLLHRDPFDRLFIGQAMEEGLVLATTDRQLLAYEGRFLSVTGEVLDQGTLPDRNA